MRQHGVGGGVQGAVFDHRGHRAEDARSDPRPPGGVVHRRLHRDIRAGDVLTGLHTHRPSVSVLYQPEGGG